MQTLYFNIHNLALVKLTSANSNLRDQVLHQLRAFEVTGPFSDSDVNIFITDFDRAGRRDQRFKKLTATLKDGYFIIGETDFAFQIGSPTIRISVGDHFTIPLNFFVQLILMEKDATLIHAAGMRIEGQNTLLPALGGVGKTIAVLGLAKAGCGFYGDDLCVLQRGTMYSFPVDFSIYDYHLQFLDNVPLAVRSQLKLSRIIDSIDTCIPRTRSLVLRFVHRALGVFSVPCFSLPAESCVSRERFQHSGRIDRIVLLKRQTDQAACFVQSTPSPDQLADICTTTLLHEWHQSFRWLMNYSIATGFDIWGLRFRILKIMRANFETSDLRELRISSSLKHSEYQSKIVSALTRGEGVE